MRFSFIKCWLSFFFFLEWSAARGDDSVRESLRLLNDLFNEDYQSARNGIVEMGSAVLPELVRLRDHDADWRVRLYAGICAERIDRGDEIDSLIHYRWDEDPETAEMFNLAWLSHVPQLPVSHAGTFRQKIEKDGLWFLYLESYAEKTEEKDWFHVFMGSSASWFPRILNEPFRLLAGHIAEENVKRNFSKGLLGGPEWLTLIEFVSDGTYTEGRKTLLEHLDITYDFPYCAIEAETDESVILALLEKYADNDSASGVLRNQLYRIRLGETSSPLKNWALTVPTNPDEVEKMIAKYQDDAILVTELRKILKRLRSSTVFAQTDATAWKPAFPMISAVPEHVTELPAVVETGFPAKTEKQRRFIGIVIASIVAVIAGAGFLLFKRRHAP